MINVPIHRIELNTTELCNRKCSFCPRAYDYPNLNLHMTADTAEEVILQTNEYTNYLCIAGRGEPLLCENILEIIELMVKYDRKFYLQTNGDHLDKHIENLDNIMNLSKRSHKYKMLVNCYDGKEQKEERLEKWKNYPGLRIVDDRTDDPELDQYKTRMKKGKYVNRAGYLPWMFEKTNNLPCYILFHKCYINWNGDIQLCCHDWKVLHSFGNIHDMPFHKIWEGNELMDMRINLSKPGGRQKYKQCKTCDAAQDFDETKSYYEQWLNNKVTRTSQRATFS